MKPRQKGSVIIITLWTITLVTILVTVIASQIRLSARAAFYQQEELGIWANQLAAVNQAEMELMLERMPRPPEEIEELDEIGRNPLFRYNGQELELAYPAAEDMVVRIYDHAGKINIRDMAPPQMRALLEKRIGEDEDDRIDELLAAWIDWHDLNNGTSVDGAERDYYESLDVPYLPRNGRMETVSEILHIRGFAEVFEGVDLDAAFTLYTGENEQINLNLATVEAMQLLPGLNDEMIAQILALREEQEIRSNLDLAEIVQTEEMADLQRWLNHNRTSNVYTIMVNQRSTEEPLEGDQAAPLNENEDTSITAFAEIVQVISGTERPRILKVNPYQRIPQRVIVINEDEF